MDVALARAWLDGAAEAVAARAGELTSLDAAIGDADHGVNMNRGLSAVRAALAAADLGSVAAVFTLAGSTLVAKVGGAAGPLYGSAFRALGKSLPDGDQVDAPALGAGLRAGLEALRKLGGAAPGDKTIVDAYAPAVDAFDAAVRRQGGDGDGGLAAAARAAAQAAAEGMRATVPLQARKGRASYLGERSIGHQDPGATSTWLIFQVLADATAP
jgi:dihydroxyacetone kinase-like protein